MAGREGISRRAMLLALTPPAAAEKSRSLPADWGRFFDPATEFEVVRLTNPQYDSVLAAPPTAVFSRKNNAVVFGSNREGKPQAFRIDISNGQSRQLSAAENLDPATVCFVPDERGYVWWDGPRLVLAASRDLKEYELARVRDGYRRVGPAVFSEDSTYAFWIERREAQSQILRMPAVKGTAEVAVEAGPGAVEVHPNPNRAMLLWRTDEGELWVAPHDGSWKRKVETPPGRVEQAFWNPAGSGIIYLLVPEDKTILNSLREQELDTKNDVLVAKTSQFYRFARNPNASVFLGASASKASPTILLMLRLTRRELTLCEHRSTDLAHVNLRFSPDSQRVIFQSNRNSTNSVYLMKLDRLVEKTEA